MVEKHVQVYLFYAFPGATEAAVVAGALVPEEAQEEGECQFVASLPIPIIRGRVWRGLTVPAFVIQPGFRNHMLAC